MKITIHTERGTFCGKESEDESPEGLAELRTAVQSAVSGDGTQITLETDNGFIVIGKQLLTTSVVVVC